MLLANTQIPDSQSVNKTREPYARVSFTLPPPKTAFEPALPPINTTLRESDRGFGHSSRRDLPGPDISTPVASTQFPDVSLRFVTPDTETLRTREDEQTSETVFLSRRTAPSKGGHHRSSSDESLAEDAGFSIRPKTPTLPPPPPGPLQGTRPANRPRARRPHMLPITFPDNQPDLESIEKVRHLLEIQVKSSVVEDPWWLSSSATPRHWKDFIQYEPFKISSPAKTQTIWLSMRCI